MKALKQIIKSGISLYNRRLSDYSRLIPVGESMGWSIDKDIEELSDIWRKIGINFLHARNVRLCERQSVFLGSQFSLLNPEFVNSSHRLAVAYFHGLPEQGHEELDGNFREFVAIKDRFTRIQVSHQVMRTALLDHGFSEQQIRRIPIAINPAYFRRWSKANRAESRLKYGVPEDAFAIGSFQKDGVGWGEGMEPKLIKGPDLFLEVMKQLRDKIPNLFVLLSGPSRGYVKKGLDDIGVPYSHHFLEQPNEISRMFECLDAYLPVASRDEGGPKAILESMLSEIPLVSSKVGQAVDLIDDGKNAFLVDVEDVDAMAGRLLEIYQNSSNIQLMRENGYKCALQNTYSAQESLWADFMKGFVGK